MEILRNNELALVICLFLSTSGVAAPEFGKPKPVSSDMKSFCETFYMLQEVYQSEHGSYAPSFEALEMKHNIQLPGLGGGYKPRLNPGQSMYRVFFTGPGKDTLVLSNSGQLKRGKEVLLALAPPEERNRIAVSGPKRKRANVVEVPKEAHSSPPQVTRIEDTSSFVINSIKYRVVKTLARIDSKSGMDETVEKLRILNPKDSICHRESWQFRPKPNGFESTRLANFTRLVGSNADGLLVIYDDSPAAPPGGTTFRIFWDRKSCLVPLIEEVPIFGHISRWNGKDSTLRLENGVLEIAVSAWYFDVTVPFKVELATVSKDKPRFTLAPGIYDVKGHFLSLKVKEQHIKNYYEEGAEIDLSSDLPFKATEKAKVPPMGKAEVLSVYLPMPSTILESPAKILDFVASNPDSMKVMVRLNGKIGWIQMHDVQKFGFPARG